MNEHVNEYINGGASLMPLVGENNIPLKRWRETAHSASAARTYKGNLAWALSASDLVVDVDPRNGGDVSYKRLCTDLGLNFDRSVVTPRGGFHIYMKVPQDFEGMKIKKTHIDYAGIDFLSVGSYCLIAGDENKHGRYKWAEENFEGFGQIEAPEKLMQKISHAAIVRDKSGGDDLGDFEGLVTRNGNMSDEDVIANVNKLDANMSHDEWVKVGMALHDWDSVDGLPIWEKWSKGGDTYKEGETEKRWRSFATGSGVTMGSVMHMTKVVDYVDSDIKVRAYIEEIERSDKRAIDCDLLPRLKKEKWNNAIDRAQIAKVLQRRIKTLTGATVPISEIRLMMQPAQGLLADDADIPTWCNNWMYVNDHSSFVKMSNLTFHDSESFDIENGRNVFANENGVKQGAKKFIADNGYIEKVDTVGYLPLVDSVVCERDGFKILNTFNPSTVPDAAESFSDEGFEAIEILKKHIKFICTTDENSQFLTQWLAHQVQFAGKKIPWSPVIQSIEGVGKSFFADLLRACLGNVNVGTVSPTQAVSAFNSWATNVVVNVLEELRITGHNRHDAVNALKPLITDPMIQINKKSVAQYSTYNTANYICLTNFKDAIPLTATDRRWWVVFVPIDDLSEMEAITGLDAEAYFDRLWNTVREHGPQLKKWLMEFPITDEFLNTKRAPMTDDKLSMIATESASFEGLDEVKDLIKKGGIYYNETAICSSDLFRDLEMEHLDLEIKTSRRNVILKKLGYMQLPKPVKIDNVTRRVWTKRHLENSEIRGLIGKN